MRRWLAWFLLVPPSFLLAGLWRDAGLPPLDVAVLLCLFLAFFAEQRALPWLLLGAAAGRTIADGASLWVQILVLGVPVAVLLPLRAMFFGQRWLWQATAAALCAIALPHLDGLGGRWFGPPAASLPRDGWHVVASALLLPPLLALVRRLPPLAAFGEPE